MFLEARWPSGRASDSGARYLAFDPHSGRRVVSLSKIHLPPKSTGNTKEAVAPSRQDWKIVYWDVKQKRNENVSGLLTITVKYSQQQHKRK